MRPLSVAIVRGSSVPLDPATYNIQELGLAKALHSIGIRCDVYMAGNSRQLTRHTIALASDAHSGIEAAFSWSIPAFGLPGEQGYFPRLSHLLDKTEYDLIQVHDDTQLTTLLVCLYARRRRIPLVLCQGMYKNYDRGARVLQCVWDALPLRVISRFTTQTVAKSGAARGYLQGKGFAPITVLPIGIDPSRLVGGKPVDWRRELGVSSTCVLAAYVGTIDDRRRLDVAVEAARRVALQGLELHMIVAGEGPGLEISRRLAVVNGRSIATFLGKLEQPNLGQLYSQADLFVLPTAYEIYGVSVVEAMFFSTPVIASATGGLLDLVRSGENGYLVPRLTACDWEQALEWFMSLAPTERVRMGENAADTARGLTWTAVASRWESVYRRVAATNRTQE
ncbi:MAG: glycosyltransferase family 4 protein [Armatimonadetes bacterium]|nr:glycosyltransferase family 4 protein [Armatimonadota bacterium]